MEATGKKYRITHNFFSGLIDGSAGRTRANPKIYMKESSPKT